VPFPQGALGCRVAYTDSSGNPVNGVTAAGHIICRVSFHSTATGGTALRCEDCSAAVNGSGCRSYSCPRHGAVCCA